MRLEIDGLYILMGSMESYSRKRVEEFEQKLKQALLRSLDPSVIQKVCKYALSDSSKYWIYNAPIRHIKSLKVYPIHQRVGAGALTRSRSLSKLYQISQNKIYIKSLFSGNWIN